MISEKNNAAVAEASDEIDDNPVVRVLVPAAGQLIPATVAPRWVFELVPMAVRPRRQDKNQEPVSAGYAGRVSVASSESGLKVIGAQYPSARWTQERADREQARRARQRPPKPTFKSRSRKLSRLLGDIGDDNE